MLFCDVGVRRPGAARLRSGTRVHPGLGSRPVTRKSRRQGVGAPLAGVPFPWWQMWRGDQRQPYTFRSPSVLSRRMIRMKESGSERFSASGSRRGGFFPLLRLARLQEPLGESRSMPLPTDTAPASGGLPRPAFPCGRRSPQFGRAPACRQQSIWLRDD
jgi:hypothetical protein